MTRWAAGVRCPNRTCGGQIEVWLESIEDTRANYQFCCTHCDLRGDWEQFARRRLAIRRGVR